MRLKTIDRPWRSVCHVELSREGVLYRAERRPPPVKFPSLYKLYSSFFLACEGIDEGIKLSAQHLEISRYLRDKHLGRPANFNQSGLEEAEKGGAPERYSDFQ